MSVLHRTNTTVASCHGARSQINQSSHVLSTCVFQRKRCFVQAVKSSAASKDDARSAPTAKKSVVYTDDMQKKMGTGLTYCHEQGINYDRIYPTLIVGSCLQTPADVDRLAQEGVTTVLNLQEDCDMAYFNIDILSIQKRCLERGDIKHVRFPIRDFDPYDLRLKLPQAISKISREFNPANGGTLYVHCTAGLGRAPAAALAYLFWMRGAPLDETFEKLRSIRPCSPRVEAVRAATADLLLGIEPVDATIGVSRLGHATEVQIAGLDVGWNQRLAVKPDPAVPGRLALRRRLLPGKYVYKFIVDGQWTYSADHPTVQDGNNTNNVLEVLSNKGLTAETAAAQSRLLSTGGKLTPDEQDQIQDLLCPWATREALRTLQMGAMA